MRRAAAYIRESTLEQLDGFSPALQLKSIIAFAKDNDLDLVETYLDSHSAWRTEKDRPQFQALMAAAGRREFDVILVFHTSRFARNVPSARKYKDMLRARGIDIVSTTQPFGEYPSNPATFLAEAINEVFDEYYSVQLSFFVSAALREKQSQGELVGSLPLGYVRDASGNVTTDPDVARFVARAFELYATGDYSDRSLAQWLNSKGIRTARDALFTRDAVRDLLKNQAYPGFVGGRRDMSNSSEATTRR